MARDLPATEVLMPPLGPLLASRDPDFVPAAPCVVNLANFDVHQTGSTGHRKIKAGKQVRRKPSLPALTPTHHPPPHQDHYQLAGPEVVRRSSVTSKGGRGKKRKDLQLKQSARITRSRLAKIRHQTMDTGPSSTPILPPSTFSSPRATTSTFTSPYTQQLATEGKAACSLPGAQPSSNVRGEGLRRQGAVVQPWVCGTHALAEALQAAKQVTWRGQGELPQLPWRQPAQGLVLVVDLWSGVGGLLVALLASRAYDAPATFHLENMDRTGTAHFPG